MAPIGLILLFLTGVGPLLAWRKSTLSNLRDQFLWPVVAGVGHRRRAAGARASALGVGAVLRAVRVRRRHDRAGVLARRERPPQRTPAPTCFTALVGLVGRNKRRYGGYIVHLGIVLMFLGFAGNGFKQDEQVLLKPGEQVDVGRYTLRNDGVKVTDDGQKQMVTAYLAVFEDGKQIDTLYPAKWFFRKHESEPTTEVGDPADVRRGSVRRARAPRRPGDAVGDACRSSSTRWSTGSGSASACMALGTGIALLPERAFSFALAKLPAEAAATTAALLLAVLLGGARASAQRSTGCGAVAGRRHVRRRTTRAPTSRSSCSTRSSAPAARAATPTSASAARIRAARRTRCAASWRR